MVRLRELVERGSGRTLETMWRPGARSSGLTKPSAVTPDEEKLASEVVGRIGGVVRVGGADRDHEGVVAGRVVDELGRCFPRLTTTTIPACQSTSTAWSSALVGYELGTVSASERFTVRMCWRCVVSTQASPAMMSLVRDAVGPDEVDLVYLRAGGDADVAAVLGGAASTSLTNVPWPTVSSRLLARELAGELDLDERTEVARGDRDTPLSSTAMLTSWPVSPRAQALVAPSIRGNSVARSGRACPGPG